MEEREKRKTGGEIKKSWVKVRKSKGAVMNPSISPFLGLLFRLSKESRIQLIDHVVFIMFYNWNHKVGQLRNRDVSDLTPLTCSPVHHFLLAVLGRTKFRQKRVLSVTTMVCDSKQRRMVRT